MICCCWVVTLLSGCLHSCFFRFSLRRCDRQTNFRLLCLWNCQIQANVLWKLVRKNTSQRLSTWVSSFFFLNILALHKHGVGIWRLLWCYLVNTPLGSVMTNMQYCLCSVLKIYRCYKLQINSRDLPDVLRCKDVSLYRDYLFFFFLPLLLLSA